MRVMAFDPSLLNLGYVYGHLIDGKLLIEKCGTFQPDKFLRKTGMFNTGHKTTNRQLAVEHFMTLALWTFEPKAVSGETCFFNGLNPDTIFQQGKGIGLIERIIRTYLTTIKSPFELVLYPPNVIKRTLGLDKLEFKDKTMINKHIEKHIKAGTITYMDKEHLPSNQLDHANDAVAMAYTLCVNITKINLIE